MHYEKLLIILGISIALSCGDSLEVENVSSKGSIGGIIFDAVTRAPLSEIPSVEIRAGSTTATKECAEDDSFTFEDVPAGEILIIVKAPAGYGDAWIRRTIPNAAGDFPTGNIAVTIGPIGLIPVTKNFKFRVLTTDGKPISGYAVTAKASVQYIDFSSGSATARGDISRRTVTDAEGYGVITPLPEFAELTGTSPLITLYLAPRDENSDGIYDYGGGIRSFNLLSLSDPTPDIILNDAFDDSLHVVTSTFSNTGPVVIQNSDDIDIKFNLPIHLSSSATLLDEQGNVLEKQPTVSVKDDNMTVALAGAELETGSEYNLTVYAVAKIGDGAISTNFNGTFFTASSPADFSILETFRENDNRVNITFSEPLGGVSSVCVNRYTVDIDASGSIGDYVNETGSPDCNSRLMRDEPSSGPMGLSGYTKYWYLEIPNFTEGSRLPEGTMVYLNFSNATESLRTFELETVPDLTLSLP